MTLSVLPAATTTSLTADLGGDIAPQVVAPAEYLADIDYHVDFVRARLENLDFGGAVDIWEPNHGADQHPATGKGGLCSRDSVEFNTGCGDLVLLARASPASIPVSVRFGWSLASWGSDTVVVLLVVGGGVDMVAKSVAKLW